MLNLIEYIIKFFHYDTGPSILTENKVASITCAYSIHAAEDSMHLEAMLNITATAVDPAYKLHFGLIGYYESAENTPFIVTSELEEELTQQLYSLAKNLSGELLSRWHFYFPDIETATPRFIRME